MALLKVGDVVPRQSRRKGLPTVMGVVLVSSAEDGRLVAVLDAGRGGRPCAHGAAAVARGGDARPGGRGHRGGVLEPAVNGEAVARNVRRPAVSLPLVWDVDVARAPQAVADRVGGARRGKPGVRPRSGSGRDGDAQAGRCCWPEGSLRAGQHVSLMGGGRFPARPRSLSPSSSVAVSIATTGSRPPTAVSSPRRWRLGAIGRGDVAQIGDVLTGTAEGRQSAAEITLLRLDRPWPCRIFAVGASVALESADRLELPQIPL